MAGTTLVMNEDSVGTVNVIKFRHPDDVTSIRDFKSWLDNEEGNEAAKKYFASIVRKDNKDITEKEISESLMSGYLMDGYLHLGGFVYTIIHSA